MEAIFKFQLPEEKDSFLLASKGIDYFSALFDLSNEIRRLNKKQASISMEELTDKFLSILDRNNVNLDEVS